MARYYRLPFANPNLLDGFGATRGRLHPHRGVDFPQPAGAPIRAVADGTVALVRWSEALGWVTVVKHTRTAKDALLGRKPVYSGYAHQDSVPAGIALGAVVTLGQVIGHVGVFGRSGTAATGSHLHLTMSHSVHGAFYGDVFDPLKFIARYPEPVPGAKPAKVRTHVVKRGETVWAIARRYDSSIAEVVALNDLADPALIRPGQKLKVPA